MLLLLLLLHSQAALHCGVTIVYNQYH